MKKKLFHLAALLCGMFLLWGCPQPEPDPVEPDVLVPISTSYTIGAEGGSISISFETNTSFQVKPEDGASWLSVVTKATKASKVESVTVMAQPNPSTEPRTANVIVTAGELKANIAIKQEGLAPSIEVTPSTGTVGPDGGSFQVTVTSNVDYSVNPDVSWIIPAGTDGGVLTFNVVANDQESDRTGTVTFSYGSVSKTVTIKQEAMVPVIEIEQKEFSVPAAGATISIPVTSNVQYQAASGSTWIHAAEDNKWVVDENPNTTARSGKITFTYKSTSVVVTVNQAAKEKEPDPDPFITVDVPEFTVPAEGSKITVNVTSNVTYVVNPDASWIKAAGGTASAKAFTVDANDSTSERTGTITFSYGTISTVVTVKQSGKVPVIEVPTTSYTVPAAGGSVNVAVTSNVEYTIELGAEWLSKAGSTSGHEAFNVAANEGAEDRSATITFKYGDLSKTVTVSQSGKGQVVEPFIEIGQTSYEIGAKGGTLAVGVSSNVEFTVETSAGWVVRQGNTTSFTIAENTAREERTATVTFKYENISKSITIVQKETDVLENGGDDTYTVPAEGGDIDILIRSNVDYIVECPAEWINEITTKTVRENHHLFKVEANTVAEERTAKITVSFGEVSIEVTVRQEAYVPPAEDPYLTLSYYTLNASAEAGEYTVDVTANYDYSVAADAAWVHANKGEGICRFSLEANSDAEARVAHLTFTSEGLEKTVTITQAGFAVDPYLTVSPTEATVPAAGGSVEVNVGANYAFTVECEEAWISIAVDGGKVTATVAENTVEENRIAMIIISSEGMVEYVTITQQAAESGEDPFDVGSNLSVNGTANCYVVTKAGNFSFDASVMGNGPDGFLWDENQATNQHLWPHKPEGVTFANGADTPAKVFIIWDLGGVIKSGSLKYDKTKKTISFTATGNKGNALIGIYDKWSSEATVASGEDEAIWSWHIWCTDSPKLHKMYDVDDKEYIILDRSIGAITTDPAESDAVYANDNDGHPVFKGYGLWYVFGRKDPLICYDGLAYYLKEAPAELKDAVAHPTHIYNCNQKTTEWFNNSSSSLATVTADLWGNPAWAYCSTVDIHPYPALRSELKKTIYDPCPPGYMVPPETTWSGVDEEELVVLDNGVIMPTATGDTFYPFAGFLSGNNVGPETWEDAHLCGWYGHVGANFKNTHQEKVAAYVATSYTSLQSPWCSDIHPNYFGYGYMSMFIDKADPIDKDHLRFDALAPHVRQRGYPVRCVKEFRLMEE